MSDSDRYSAPTPNRAVSDVVAFVLTFAIIIAGVGLVSTGAFDRLTAFTDEQRIDNAERGMEAAASTIDSLGRGNDTYREFALSLSGGNVWFRNSTITIENSSANLSRLPGGSADSADIPVNALEHRFEFGGETVRITHEGGGVFRTDTARPRYDPAITVEDGTLIVSLINLTSDETIDRSGTYDSNLALDPTGVPTEAPVSADKQFVSFSAELIGQRRVYNSTVDDPDITVDVSASASPEQWGYFFSEAEGWTSTGDATYTPDERIDTVLIRVSTIRLSTPPRRTT
ncbi:hypothetical protein GRX03_08515 [Halovenus sp. WSH3]|uniref:Uncharacterized protein n=1 Tax=Halovenus carboxidivorans TaxID=2692199 RepID=A0A6B0T0S5_9EURY|nr:hypothetical protein [Halovenus carboxidivorans]MXR51644.1 hypothetical protein [Halovenus carboxidivorans]